LKIIKIIFALFWKFIHSKFSTFWLHITFRVMKSIYAYPM